MQRSTHLTTPTGPSPEAASRRLAPTRAAPTDTGPNGLSGSRAPVPQPGMVSSGLAESGQQTEGSGQVSALTMTLFVAGGIAFALWVGQEPTQIVTPAPGPT